MSDNAVTNINTCVLSPCVHVHVAVNVGGIFNAYKRAFRFHVSVLSCDSFVASFVQLQFVSTCKHFTESTLYIHDNQHGEAQIDTHEGAREDG